MVDLRVAPAAELAPGYVLVSFIRARPGPAACPGRVVGTAPGERRPSCAISSASWSTCAQRGCATPSERAGAPAEEYKSSNEELQSMNEELRSASEELETSREELQSHQRGADDGELRNSSSNVEEIGRANSDLHNLMNATSIATVFLDRELRVMRLHARGGSDLPPDPQRRGPPAGRPSAARRLPRHGRGRAPGAAHARAAGTCAGRHGGANWFLARLSPYRSLEERIEGVVLTFVDITERKTGGG